jgi:hypothetical protein
MFIPEERNTIDFITFILSSIEILVHGGIFLFLSLEEIFETYTYSLTLRVVQIF